jgi:hypothetical protein
MNEQITTCHEFHGFKWEKINIYLILTCFVCNSIPFLAHWNMITPFSFGVLFMFITLMTLNKILTILS